MSTTSIAINADVVEELKCLLRLAQDGRITGLVYAYANERRMVTTSIIPGTSSCHDLNSGVALLQYELCSDVFDEMREVSSEEEESEEDVPEDAVVVPIGERKP